MEATQERKIICLNKECPKKGKAQREDNFYNSRVEGMDKYPLCKACIKDLLFDGDIDQVLKLLKAMNYPFYEEAWNNAKAMSPTNPFGTYVSKIGSLAQYKDKTWDDSEFLAEEEDIEEVAQEPDDEDEIVLDKEEKKELLKLFGRGFNDMMLAAMRDKYNALKEGYPDSPLHREALTNYVKYKVQEETCIAIGDADGAETWSKQAQKQADIAKLNPKQISEKDLDEGLSAISTLSLMVEKGIDIIPIMPQYMYSPRDLPDFVLYCLMEKLREEKGMPPVSYADTYKWYDRKLQEYIDTYGDSKGALQASDKMQRKIAEKFVREGDDINNGKFE